MTDEIKIRMLKTIRPDQMMQAISGMRKDLTTLCQHQEGEACTFNQYCEYQKVVQDPTRETGMRITCGLEEQALALSEEPVVPEDLPEGGRLK